MVCFFSFAPNWVASYRPLNTGSMRRPIFLFSWFRCFLTSSQDFWSLKGTEKRTILFYVRCSCRHLYHRVQEHKSSAVGVHFKNCHKSLKHFDTNFTFLRQCKTKFDCLVYEILFIKELKPSLHVQSDSLKAKLL